MFEIRNISIFAKENNSELLKLIFQVTKLDRDPSSGTALQEISFWLNLERALHRIQEKRESLEVALTLDILKHGKRFHATVSFDTDTGVYKGFTYLFTFNGAWTHTELPVHKSALAPHYANLML